MILVIPARTDPLTYRMQVELEGVNYDLRFRLNRRDGAWRVSIGRGGVDLLSNVKLVHGSDLLSQYRHIEDLPPGSLIVNDQDGQNRDPSEETLGDRVLVLYQEAA